jgi:hypothetical protein
MVVAVIILTIGFGSVIMVQGVARAIKVKRYEKRVKQEQKARNEEINRYLESKKYVRY